MATMERFVWDGDQLVFEQRAKTPYTVHGSGLETEESGGNFYGRIRYALGTELDRPILRWQDGGSATVPAGVRSGSRSDAGVTHLVDRAAIGSARGLPVPSIALTTYAQSSILHCVAAPQAADLGGLGARGPTGLSVRSVRRHGQGTA